MTSMPTTSRPAAHNGAASASPIARSRAESGCATPRPPTARLPRVSPGFGMRASEYGTTSPAISRMRLSPSTISGMKRCAITVRAPSCETVSTMTLRLGSASRTRNTDAPPMPSSGLTITSPCSSMNSPMRRASRVTSVGAMYSRNSAIAIFSL